MLRVASGEGPKSTGQFQGHDASFLADKPRLVDIDVRQTVGEMKKGALRDVVGRPSGTFRVFHRDIGGPGGDEELRLPNRPLHMLKLKTGDELHIVDK